MTSKRRSSILLIFIVKCISKWSLIKYIRKHHIFRGWLSSPALSLRVSAVESLNLRTELWIADKYFICNLQNQLYLSHENCACKPCSAACFGKSNYRFSGSKICESLPLKIKPFPNNIFKKECTCHLLNNQTWFCCNHVLFCFSFMPIHSMCECSVCML